MYAVIESGGKQYRVEQGQRLAVERLAGDGEIALRPVLVVDGDDVFATASQLSGASVTARVVGETKGPKINGFKYRDKTNWRRRFGHRQHYTEVEILSISKG
jgi:large subunit ribosomal protein L21